MRFNVPDRFTPILKMVRGTSCMQTVNVSEINSEYTADAA